MIVTARPEHLNAIDNIYNQAVADGYRTAHLEPLNRKERMEWFNGHREEKYPVFVWVDGDRVLGWLSISPYRPGRSALDEVAEVSYYVHYDHQGKGIGSRLMEHGITFCRKQGFRILVAIMVSGNEASKKLAHKFGFTESGRIKNALRYGESMRDHLYMSLEVKS